MAITTNGKVSITNLQVGSSADLAGIISDESGTGVLAFTNTPTFTTPVLGTASATAIELGHASDTTLTRASAGVVAIEGVNVVTETATQTLSNKTLTTPIISSITNTGTLTLPTATGTVALTSDITITGSSKLDAFAATTSAELAGVISDETGSGALVFGTSPAITGGTLANTVLKGIEEDINVVASAATGTIDFDVDTASIWYYTSDATGDFTLNFRFSSGVSLDTALATGDSITLVFLNTNGATPYYPDVIEIDGNAVTPKVPAAIAAGNASAIDAYSFTIIKTASATFTVLETQTKFA
jgi:hypothetical protein